MQQQALDHLGRIGELCAALAAHPAYGSQDQSLDFNRLTEFDGEFWTFTRYLSLLLYQETTALLAGQNEPIRQAPCIAVVMAVHRPDPQLLRLAIRSVLNQIGIRVHLHLSLDGPEGNRPLVEQVLTELAVDPNQVSLHAHPDHRGVGLCRNAALATVQQDWFTFLDCDDLFHPLRSLHAWLALRSYSGLYLKTSYSRVSLRQGKIVMLQDRLSHAGGNSFLAHRQVLSEYGYLAPLRFWEDTEYQQRLHHFKAPMLTSSAVGHYQNTAVDPGYRSLGTRWRKEAHPIEGHPYLCGTVLAEIDSETCRLRDHYQALYHKLRRDQLPAVFPSQGSSCGWPPGQQGDAAALDGVDRLDEEHKDVRENVRELY